MAGLLRPWPSSCSQRPDRATLSAIASAVNSVFIPALRDRLGAGGWACSLHRSRLDWRRRQRSAAAAAVHRPPDRWVAAAAPPPPRGPCWPGHHGRPAEGQGAVGLIGSGRSWLRFDPASGAGAGSWREIDISCVARRAVSVCDILNLVLLVVEGAGRGPLAPAARPGPAPQRDLSRWCSPAECSARPQKKNKKKTKKVKKKKARTTAWCGRASARPSFFFPGPSRLTARWLGSLYFNRPSRAGATALSDTTAFLGSGRGRHPGPGRPDRAAVGAALGERAPHPGSGLCYLVISGCLLVPGLAPRNASRGVIAVELLAGRAPAVALTPLPAQPRCRRRVDGSGQGGLALGSALPGSMHELMGAAFSRPALGGWGL